MAFVPHLQEHGIHVDQGINRLQRPALPIPGPVQDLVRDRAHRLGRDLVAIEVLNVGLDVPGGHPLGVHRDDFVLEPGDVLLAFLNDLGLEIGFPVPRDIQADLAIFGFDGLGRELARSGSQLERHGVFHYYRLGLFLPFHHSNTARLLGLHFQYEAAASLHPQICLG